MNKIGAYIHIPFCKQKCIYCDFISFANEGEMVYSFVKKVYGESINKRNRKLENKK